MLWVYLFFWGGGEVETMPQILSSCIRSNVHVSGKWAIHVWLSRYKHIIHSEPFLFFFGSFFEISINHFNRNTCLFWLFGTRSHFRDMPCVASSSRLFIPPSLNLRVFEEKSPRKFLLKHIDHNKTKKSQKHILTNKWDHANPSDKMPPLSFLICDPGIVVSPRKPWRHWPSCLPVQRHQQRLFQLRSGRMQRPSEAGERSEKIIEQWSFHPGWLGEFFCI